MKTLDQIGWRVGPLGHSVRPCLNGMSADRFDPPDRSAFVSND